MGFDHTMAEDDAINKLFRFARFGKVKEVKEVLEKGTLDVNVKDTKGDTLLHVAARNNHKNIVKELLRRNCAYDTKNMQGKEAWELAFEFNYTDLGEYIRVKTGLPPMADSKVPNAQEDVDKAGGVGRGNEDDDLLGMLGLGASDPKASKAGKDSMAPDTAGDSFGIASLPKKTVFDPLRGSSVGLPSPGGFGVAGAQGSENKTGGGGGSFGTAPAVSQSPAHEEVTGGRGSRLSQPASGRTSRTELDAGEGGFGVGGGRLSGGRRDGGRDGVGAGGGARPNGDSWRDRVDFALVKSALESLAQGQEGSTSLCNVGVDQAFWTQVEGLREAIGLDKVEQHAKTLEGVVEKLWGRYALVRREDVNGVRLQSELRGLAAKMGDGADINSVLDERDRLRRKVDNLTSLEDKAKGLDVEIRELRSRLEEARRAADEHEGHARSERRARETAETKLRGVERERDDLEREVRDAKEATAAERSAAERMQGDLNKVKKIKVAWLQPAELDELFKRHDRDNSGDISPDEMKSLVEELCGIMEKRMESAQGDAQREAERARHAEEDRARDKQRAKEAEERLTEQIKRLDRELEDSDKAARKQQVQMQERSDKLKARLEAAVEAAKADGEAEVKRTQHEAETHLAAREALHAERYAGLENASAEEVRRRKEREAQLEGELGGEKKRADGLEERLKASDKSLNENKARVARLEKEAAASKEQSVLQEVFALHPRLGSARKALEGLRAEVLQMNEEASDAIRSVGEQLGHFCSFVLPLPHEAPDRVRTEKLTRAQLEQGLKHMMGKYRGAAEQNRRVNLELQGLKGAMRVNCRVRPLRPGPEAEDGTCVHLRGLGALSVLDKNGTREYNFDTVYGPNNKQDKLFDDARPLLQTVMDGFNVSVMAYGATGSGKTYTITGAGISGGASGKHRGLVQRLLEDVFKTIKERAVLVELSLRISMFEIYNEEVRDLLAPSSAPKAGAGQAGSRLPLKISTDRHGSVAIDGLEEYAVDSLAKGLGLVEFGQGVRATAATNINEHSSRSHLLIRLTVHSVDKRTGQRHSGKMYLIDLAGCENVAQSGAEGRALKEAIGINKSLAALHDVMLALANKDQHVPYRNSTLTKVLADSLGGQAKCLMYVMVSPASKDRLVTISALKFAARCKAIVLGEAKSNVDKSVFDELADARDKLEKLQVQMEECAAARRDAEERTSLSAEIIAEASHFEVKLRDLFGLSANGKKDKGGGKKGAGEGHGAGETPGLALGNKGGGGKKGKKGIKAMYLDEASRHLIVKRQVHDELIKSLSRGVDAFGEALRQKDFEIDDLMRKNKELEELVAAAEKAKALEMERKHKRERERRERSHDSYEASFSAQDRSGYLQRDKDALSPLTPRLRSKKALPKPVAWDDREREERGVGGRDRIKDRERDRDGLPPQQQGRLALENRPEWDRRTRNDSGMMKGGGGDARGGGGYRRWDDRGGDGRGGGGFGGRMHHDSLYQRGAGAQWGPQGKASRNVSARLEERRAEVREREREQQRDFAPRAVSSPQVSAGLKHRISQAERPNLPQIIGGLG